MLQLVEMVLVDNYTVTVASGAITGITINDDGSGYTQASIDNALLRTATSSSGSGATFDIIISPKNGHGVRPSRRIRWKLCHR